MSDEFSGMPSMPDLESFNMESFDMNMEFNMEDFPDMPSFNNEFNMDGMGNLVDEDIGNFSDISVEESQLEQQEFEESSRQEVERACTEDGESGEQENLSDGSMTPTERNETFLVDSDENNGHRPDVENEDDTLSSSQERENSAIMDNNEKLLAILSQKKRKAFEKLPKRDTTDDSSQSEEGELILQKARKSSMKSTKSKEKKNVEFELPKVRARPKKVRYGPDGREQTEVEAQACDYIEQMKFPSTSMNLDIYRHRDREQDVFENLSFYHSIKPNLHKLNSSKKVKAEILVELGKLRERQEKILEEVRSLEALEGDAEVLVSSFDQRLKRENKSYETLREELEKILFARCKLLSLNRKVELKNQLLEKAREDWIKRKENFKRTKESTEAKIRSLMRQGAEDLTK